MESGCIEAFNLTTVGESANANANATQFQMMMDMLKTIKEEQEAVKTAIEDIRTDHGYFKEYLDEKIDPLKESVMKKIDHIGLEA